MVVLSALSDTTAQLVPLLRPKLNAQLVPSAPSLRVEHRETVLSAHTAPLQASPAQPAASCAVPAQPTVMTTQLALAMVNSAPGKNQQTLAFANPTTPNPLPSKAQLLTLSTRTVIQSLRQFAHLRSTSLMRMVSVLDRILAQNTTSAPALVFTIKILIIASAIMLTAILMHTVTLFVKMLPLKPTLQTAVRLYSELEKRKRLTQSLISKEFPLTVSPAPPSFALLLRCPTPKVVNKLLLKPSPFSSINGKSTICLTHHPTVVVVS